MIASHLMEIKHKLEKVLKEGEKVTHVAHMGTSSIWMKEGFLVGTSLGFIHMVVLHPNFKCLSLKVTNRLSLERVEDMVSEGLHGMGE